METKGKQRSDGTNDGFLNKCKKKVVETYKEVSTRGKKKKSRKVKEFGVEETTAMSPAAKGGKKEREFMKDLTEAQKNNYEKFTRTTLATGVIELLREYNEQLKPYQAKEFKREIFDKNAAKNRYRDVVCNDLTRIVLDGPGGDYIHANLVKVEGCKNEFICTQGPTPTTTHEFWRMIVQNTVNHVIMLCEIVEQGKSKCEQYWPVKEGEKMNFGDIQITNTKVEPDKKGAVIKTYLLVTKGSTSMELRHHLWKQWPDKLIPASSLASLRVLQAVRVSERPIVVHCSAGIGRTGTMVAIEICLQKLITTGQLSLLQMCKKLRELQYLYLAQTIMEYGKAHTFWTDPEVNAGLEKFKVQVEMLTKHPRTKATTVAVVDERSVPDKLKLVGKEEKEKEKEKEEETEKLKEKQRELEQQREKERQREREKELEKEKEREKELEREKERERMKEKEKQREKEKEKEREKEREKEKERDRREPKTTQKDKSEDHPRAKKTPAKPLGPIPVAPPHVINASPLRVHVIQDPDPPAPVEPPKAVKEKEEPNYLIPKVAEAPAHTPVNVYVMSPAVTPAMSPLVCSPAKSPAKPEPKKTAKAASAETAEINTITAFGGLVETPIVLEDEVAPTPPVTQEAPKAAAPAPAAPAVVTEPAARKKEEKEFINSVFM